MEFLEQVMSEINIEPRTYQRRLVEKALTMFCGPFEGRHGQPQPAAHSVMIESPTGKVSEFQDFFLDTEDAGARPSIN